MIRCVLMLAAAVGVAALGSTARQPDAPSGPIVALEARVPNLGGRLGTLSPSRPVEYFELGEEVLAEATEFAHKRLARELFVLALVLDRRASDAGAGSPGGATLSDRPSVGASACLALAFMSETEDDRRWLRALAATLGSDPAVDIAPARSTAVSRDPAAFELATLLGWVRAGEGRRAERILEKPGVSALLEKCDKLLAPGIGGGADRVRRVIEQYPLCQQCRNRRYIKGPEGVSLCPSCHGHPGVALSSREIINQLKVESMLLSGVQRSWAGQMAADGGSPMRDLDPSEVALTLGVNPDRPLWRNGRWAADPGAAPAKGSGGDPAEPPATPAQPPSPEAASQQAAPVPRP